MSPSRTTAECLTLLGLDKPRVVGKSQEEVDAKLIEWKQGALKKAYKQKSRETHPDLHPDDVDAGDKFKAVTEAYAQLEDLKVNLKMPINRCPTGHERVPSEAKFCHECGHCFIEDPLVARLKHGGVVDSSITYLKESGELKTMQAMNPWSSELHNRIQLVLQRQRLGLLGRHSPWGV